MILGIPLSLSVSVANVSMKCALEEANHGTTCSKAVSPRSQVKYNEYTGEGLRMEGYAAENGPAKAARHYSQLRRSQVTMRLTS